MMVQYLKLKSNPGERWGWPVKELQGMVPAGTWGACRGDTSNDNSADYYQVHVKNGDWLMANWGL